MPLFNFHWYTSSHPTTSQPQILQWTYRQNHPRITLLSYSHNQDPQLCKSPSDDEKEQTINTYSDRQLDAVNKLFSAVITAVIITLAYNRLGNWESEAWNREWGGPPGTEDFNDSQVVTWWVLAQLGLAEKPRWMEMAGKPWWCWVGVLFD